jgi:membrane fusion protein (multidrug efflux system)
MVLVAACSHGGPTAEETSPAMEPVRVRVEPVATATVERVADLVGSFFAYEEVDVASELTARIAWLGPDMGDEVQAGDVILRLDDATIRAELREVEARLVKAHADNTRAQQLRGEGIMSSEEAEKASTDTAVLEAQRDALKVKLDRTVIRSPLNGSIAARVVSVGEVVEQSKPVYRVVQDDPLKFRTPIPERFARFLRIGQEVRLGVAAYPDRVFVGKITRINPTADAANRSIVIEAELPNSEHLVKPGFFGSGKIVYDEHAPALVVPETALTSFAGVTKLFVIKDGKAEERVVRTGLTLADNRREIADGVTEGESVAISNVDKLEHGAPVAIVDGAPVAQVGVE